MAQSPAHRFGQIIGEVLETATLPLLTVFAKEHGLYLDQKGKRPCRSGRKCTWRDSNGNSHDLDYVLERNGTPEKLGSPVAFIETAWRRYTKHSRNKVQEIQGALIPLTETYRSCGPFLGAILAGVFTEGALTQLKSLGFTILYFPYDSLVEVFKKHGIDAAFSEETPDRVFARKVRAYKAMPLDARQAMAAELLKSNRTQVDQFMASLTTVVERQICQIIILPLHGKTFELATVEEAVRFVRQYKDGECPGAVDRYEILIRYNNGNEIKGSFKLKEDAIRYLRSFQPLSTT